MGRATTRGPYAKTAARRRDILRAARESFDEHGYAASSLRDIAERAGTTHAVVQHHFSSKDDLLTAVLTQRDIEEHEHGEQAVDGFGSLAGYLGDLLLRHQEDPELMRLWLELAVAASRSGHPAHAYFVERQDRVRTLLAEPMRELAARGELTADVDVDSVLTLLHALLSGLQIVWLLDPRLDIAKAFSQFMELAFSPNRSQTETTTR
jgi:AcrR family transcriptional regulator